MSMECEELEDTTRGQGNTKGGKKSISLKLKKEERDRESNGQVQEEVPPKNQVESLNWNFKVKLAGEKKGNKENLLNFCEKCKRPILVHGRLIPCKHFLCLVCAQNGTRNCFKCETPIKGIQPVPKVFVCAQGGTRHSVTGCRKSYLNLHGLDQHQKLRHSGEGNSSADIDSDGEFSVNKPAQPPQQQQQQPQPQPQQLPPQPAPAMPQPQYSLPLQPPAGLPMPPNMARPMIFPQIQAQSVAAAQNAAAQAAAVAVSNASHFTGSHQARPTAVLLFRPPIAVTSMPLLQMPPTPQMLPLPGMLPQPTAMMPMPGQFAPPSGGLRPEQLPRPPSMPMPENMRGDVPRSTDSPQPVQSAPRQETPPPPPPARPPAAVATVDESRYGGYGGYQAPNTRTSYQRPEPADLGPPRDPRKAMLNNVPPPPPPKNGSVR